jgi:hypothetical protein
MIDQNFFRISRHEPVSSLRRCAHAVEAGLDFGFEADRFDSFREERHPFISRDHLGAGSTFDKRQSGFVSEVKICQSIRPCSSQIAWRAKANLWWPKFFQPARSASDLNSRKEKARSAERRASVRVIGSRKMKAVRR